MNKRMFLRVQLNMILCMKGLNHHILSLEAHERSEEQMKQSPEKAIPVQAHIWSLKRLEMKEKNLQFEVNEMQTLLIRLQGLAHITQKLISSKVHLSRYKVLSLPDYQQPIRISLHLGLTISQINLFFLQHLSLRLEMVMKFQ